MDSADNEQIVDLLMADAVINCVTRLGLEGCKEAIERVYPKDSVIRNLMLAMYLKIYGK